MKMEDAKGLPAQESYNEAHQQNAQPLHYLPAGTNILALWGVFLISHSYTINRRQALAVGLEYDKTNLKTYT